MHARLDDHAVGAVLLDAPELRRGWQHRAELVRVRPCRLGGSSALAFRAGLSDALKVHRSLDGRRGAVGTVAAHHGRQGAALFAHLCEESFHGSLAHDHTHHTGTPPHRHTSMLE